MYLEQYGVYGGYTKKVIVMQSDGMNFLLLLETNMALSFLHLLQFFEELNLELN